MPLPPGSRLGHYEVIAPLGEGGMGVVYRARDSKLKRDVALKVLPPDVAGDPERLARFQREAEVLASLNHPHIAQIYGIEESGGHHALVMEVVDGPTLSDRIGGRPMPIDEVRAIALQIIDALAFAHQHNVIHRDLKPANIKLTGDGEAKVLDFGLAKALDPQVGESGSQANSPTITSPAMTKAGMFLGTAAYMAPEQARGIVVDKRADIWAFGVVVYEMLTGERLFEGASVSDTLANVLKTEPDWNRLPANTPLEFRKLLRHCLVRDRKLRLQDIADARFELESTAYESRPAGTRSRRAMGFAAAAFLAGISATLLAWPRIRTEPESPPAMIKFLITRSDGVEIENQPMFVLSPNGRSIALRGYNDGSLLWFVRDLRSGAITRLAGSRNFVPAFSPDGQWLAFTAGGVLYKVALDGSRQQPIVRSGAFGHAGVWLDSGEILVLNGNELDAIGADSGAVKRVMSQKRDQPVTFGLPNFFPAPGTFLIGENPGTVIQLASMSGDMRRLENGVAPQFAEPGWLLAARAQQILAWRTDWKTGAVTGEAQVVVDRILSRTAIAGRAFQVSRDGRVLAYGTPQVESQTHLTWFDREGREGATIKLSLHCRNPELSPDESKVAVECYETDSNNRDIWVYDLMRDTGTRFTTDPADDSDPVWSPDGRQLAFSSSRSGPPDVYVKPSGGALEEKLLLETSGPTPIMDWSPDSKTMLLMSTTQMNILVMNSDGKTPEREVMASPFIELEPQFSPDGKFFTYGSDESGRAEVYVQPWPPSGEKWQISTNGGNDARWRADGKEVFYINGARELMAVPITLVPKFSAGTPTRLFASRVTGPTGSGHRFSYAASRDGKRFLMYIADVRAELPSISVLVNWQSLLAK